MRGDRRIFQRGSRWWIACSAPERTDGERKSESRAATLRERPRSFFKKRRDELAMSRLGIQTSRVRPRRRSRWTRS